MEMCGLLTSFLICKLVIFNEVSCDKNIELWMVWIAGKKLNETFTSWLEYVFYITNQLWVYYIRWS